jgi:hypothetical protein
MGRQAFSVDLKSSNICNLGYGFLGIIIAGLIGNAAAPDSLALLKSGKAMLC